MAAEFKHSKVLFTQKDARAIKFRMTHCEESKKLKPLIEVSNCHHVPSPCTGDIRGYWWAII